MRVLLHKLLSWCPFYRIALGGYWYYRHVQERRYHPIQFCSYGKDVDIGDDVLIRSPEKMKIGDGANIADNCFIDAAGGFQMGNYSGMGQFGVVLTTDHQPDGESIPFDDTRIVKPVIIEDYVWIGRNVSILSGITIGEGAIIGLGAVVRRDVPPCAIVMGNPARVVGHRDKEHFCSLKNSGGTRPPGLGRRRFWIPAEMKHKYYEFLKEIGYDVDSEKVNFGRTGRE